MELKPSDVCFRGVVTAAASETAAEKSTPPRRKQQNSNRGPSDAAARQNVLFPALLRIIIVPRHGKQSKMYGKVFSLLCQMAKDTQKGWH